MEEVKTADAFMLETLKQIDPALVDKNALVKFYEEICLQRLQMYKNYVGLPHYLDSMDTRAEKNGYRKFSVAGPMYTPEERKKRAKEELPNEKDVTTLMAKAEEIKGNYTSKYYAYNEKLEEFFTSPKYIEHFREMLSFYKDLLQRI